MYISLSADNHLEPLRTAYSMYIIIDTTVYFYVDLIHVFCIAKYVKKKRPACILIIQKWQSTRL